jgi:dUTP pyrophosphatase
MEKIKVTKEDLNGAIKYYDLDVVMKMCERQVEQGNPFDPNVFAEKPAATFLEGGFDWEDTPDGFNYWHGIVYGTYKNMIEVPIVNKSDNETPKGPETEQSAGIDLKYSGETKVLKPLERGLFSTGLFIQLPQGYEAQVRPRSGLALKKGITVLNTPGTIDADYRGEIGVILINLSNENVTIEKGDRIAQLVISEYVRPKFISVEKLNETERGEGGFGHTGK